LIDTILIIATTWRGKLSTPEWVVTDFPVAEDASPTPVRGLMTVSLIPETESLPLDHSWKKEQEDLLTHTQEEEKPLMPDHHQSIMTENLQSLVELVVGLTLLGQLVLQLVARGQEALAMV